MIPQSTLKPERMKNETERAWFSPIRVHRSLPAPGGWAARKSHNEGA